MLVREAAPAGCAAGRIRALLDTGMDEETRRLAERVCAQGWGRWIVCSCPDGPQKDG